MRLRSLLLFLVLLATVFATGCWSTARYQTAQTIEPGESSFGVGFSAMSVQNMCAEVEDETTGESARECTDDISEVWIPNLIPDMFFRFGLAEDMDLGFKLQFIGLAADLKYRLFHNDSVHVAIDPTLRATFPLVIVREYAADLPLIVTFDFGAASLYASAAGTIGSWSIPFVEDNDASVTTGGFNGQVGLSFEVGTWYIRPEVGYTRQFLIAAGDDATVGLDMDWLNVGIGFGFVNHNQEK